MQRLPGKSASQRRRSGERSHRRRWLRVKRDNWAGVKAFFASILDTVAAGSGLNETILDTVAAGSGLNETTATACGIYRTRPNPDYSWSRSSGYTLSHTKGECKRRQVAARPSLALRVSMGP